MRISNKAYDFLKWFALTCLPAFQIFWNTVGKVWNFPYLAEISATIGAVGLLIAALIGVSTKAYNEDAKLEAQLEAQMMAIAEDGIGEFDEEIDDGLFDNGEA